MMINNKQIQITANKLIQSMKRDWIVLGRKPSGLAAASILLASNIHKNKIN